MQLSRLGCTGRAPRTGWQSSWQGDALQVILASQSCLLPVNTECHSAVFLTYRVR